MIGKGDASEADASSDTPTPSRTPRRRQAGRPTGGRTATGPVRYYESIDLEDAFHPQTILAYEMNGQTLPVAHGAPLRLRLERQLGYKQAKYIMRIEVVDSLAKFGRVKADIGKIRATNGMPASEPARRCPRRVRPDVSEPTDRRRRAAVRARDGRTRSDRQPARKGQCAARGSIPIYERGEALKSQCEALLRNAEMRIEKITLGADGNPTGVERIDME